MCWNATGKNLLFYYRRNRSLDSKHAAPADTCFHFCQTFSSLTYACGKWNSIFPLVRKMKMHTNIYKRVEFILLQCVCMCLCCVCLCVSMLRAARMNVKNRDYWSPVRSINSARDLDFFCIQVCVCVSACDRDYTPGLMNYPPPRIWLRDKKKYCASLGTANI